MSRKGYFWTQIFMLRLKKVTSITYYVSMGGELFGAGIKRSITTMVGFMIFFFFYIIEIYGVSKEPF